MWGASPRLVAREGGEEGGRTGKKGEGAGKGEKRYRVDVRVRVIPREKEQTQQNVEST